MGVYAHILKNWQNHDPEKVYLDAALACFRMNASFYFYNVKDYSPEGRLELTYTGVSSGKVSLKETDQQFILNITNVNMEDIELGRDTEFDYLQPNSNLCSLSYIEKVREDNTELIFRFAYEYLQLNPDEYFWFEWDYLFGWTEMQRLKQRPFDKDWCFKKVEP